MKKLLFLIAAIGFAFSLNAQQISVRQHDAPASTQKQSIEKMDVKLTAKPANILNANVADIQKSSKSTNAPVYTPVGTINSAAFAAKEMGKQPTEKGVISLFPDSMAFDYQYRVDDPDSSFKILQCMAMGYAFDPYSTSFDYSGEGMTFFSHADTLYGYKIDTVLTLGEYRIADYNAASPDTLRFYAFTLDAYVGEHFREEYYGLSITFGAPSIPDRRAIGPIVEYTDPIRQKGNAVTPKAGDFIQWDHILTPADSVVVETGYIRGRYIKTVVPNGGHEVAPGSLFVVMAKFIPGYNYELNDTISIQEYNKTDNSVRAVHIKKNRFRIWYWEIPDGETGNKDELYYLWDFYGYNTHLVEDKDLRYAMDTTDFGNGAFYSGLWPYKPAFYLSVQQSDQYLTRITGTIEPDELISGVYPNPATSQLTIDLKEEGQANVAIYNILGQALIQENVYDMSNTINISGLSQGMYVVKVTQNGKVNTVKFSKQ